MTDSGVDQTDNCPMKWDEGDPEKYALVHHLSFFKLSAQAVIHVDPLFVNAIFAQKKEKSGTRAHRVQTISVDMEMEMESATQEKICAMFEQVKRDLNPSDSALYLSTANKLAQDILSAFPLFVLSNQKEKSKEALLWCIAAYSLVIQPTAPVRLRVKPLGSAREPGFAIYAKKNIAKGEYIHDLIGLMPKDRAGCHSNLSTITPHPDSREDQKTQAFDPKILFGPIRFINHRCSSYNAEYVAIQDSFAFTISATQNIKENQEILVCYGVDYFKEKGSECLCEDCDGKLVEEDMEKPKDSINIEERAEAVKAKRKRQRASRKLGQKS